MRHGKLSYKHQGLETLMAIIFTSRKLSQLSGTTNYQLLITNYLFPNYQTYLIWEIERLYIAVLKKVRYARRRPMPGAGHGAQCPMPGAGHGALCRIVPHLSEKGYI
jgi:hypothetical protein